MSYSPGRGHINTNRVASPSAYTIPTARNTTIAGGGGGTAIAMAQLHRFVKLHDRFDTQIFTFILPSSLVKDASPDVYSRDFIYGYHKWNISFVRGDKHVSSYITLKNLADGMICSVDYSFTVLNKEHFTKNESFFERGSEFTIDQCSHGRKTFIGISDLVKRNFAFENGEFLVELELRNMRTTFEQTIHLPRESKDQLAHNYVTDYTKMESTYFTFGNMDWNVSLFPTGDNEETEGNPVVHLVRQTSFSHFCKVRYSVSVGYGDRGLDSGTLEQFLDDTGYGEGYILPHRLTAYAHKGRLRVRVDLYSVSAISQVKIQALNLGKNQAHCYDRDKQAWMIDSEVDAQFLTLRLFYTDIMHVPRKFSRYVCWGVSVIPARGKVKPARCIGAPYSNYYAQAPTDDGFNMQTDITAAEVGNSN